MDMGASTLTLRLDDANEQPGASNLDILIYPQRPVFACPNLPNRIHNNRQGALYADKESIGDVCDFVRAYHVAVPDSCWDGMYNVCYAVGLGLASRRQLCFDLIGDGRRFVRLELLAFGEVRIASEEEIVVVKHGDAMFFRGFLGEFGAVLDPRRTCKDWCVLVVGDRVEQGGKGTNRMSLWLLDCDL